MIQITKIEPLLGNIREMTLSDIENDFFNKVGSSPKNKLTKLLEDNEIKENEKNIIRLIINDDNYKKLITGNFKQLLEIKKEIKEYQVLISDGKKLTDLGKKIRDSFNYTNDFCSKADKGVWFASMLNIKTCPYCNAQYTLTVNVSKKKALRKFQFDHFFPISIYPYFSVSLYNLIPSCASCNHKKSNTDVIKKYSDDYYHPYYNSLANFSEFKLQIYQKNKIDLKNYSFYAIRDMDYEKDLDIDFIHKDEKYKKLINNHKELYDIVPIYKRHKDHAHELLVKSILNDKYYRDSITSIAGLFPDKATLYKYLLGNYKEEEDILKRPLSKFYQDIAKQLGLIDNE